MASFVMRRLLYAVGLLSHCNLAITSGLSRRNNTTAPEASALNGSYYGVYSPEYNQDFFLGIPYAHPPVGDLRYRIPQPLNTTWTDDRNATDFSASCWGYGGDSENYRVTPFSEDCLTLNIIRPSGYRQGDKLPVMLWIHGGSFKQGSSSEPITNQSFIVQRSVEMDMPMIAISIQYRLGAWGWLWGKELEAEGASNLGLRDQRMAMKWVQENIAGFGGDPSKVVVQGQSAGAVAIGGHTVAYGGRDDRLYRGAILQSGTPASYTTSLNASSWQKYYDAVVSGTNCTGVDDTLSCLRTVPAETLSNAINSTAMSDAVYIPVIDGDMFTESTTTTMRKGKFVKIPVLLGTNFDEGGTFGTRNISTNAEFRAMLISSGANITSEAADKLEVLYPDIPEIGIPATFHGRPSIDSGYGLQWKRSAAFGGDNQLHSSRRLMSQTWTKYNTTLFSYHFDVLTSGETPEVAVAHATESVFTFDNTIGNGYGEPLNDIISPLAGKPENTYFAMAKTMSSMWISFVNHLDPNYSNSTGVYWPRYDLGNPQNLVFDVNVTDLVYIEPDVYRAEAIAFLSDNYEEMFGR